MAATSDIQQAIWTEPWFLKLSVEAKALYLWALTSSHSNLAGLYTAGESVIQLESGLSPARFEKALGELEGRLVYRPESGVVWVVGRVQKVRSKTTQIAKSVANAVRDCPDSGIQALFIENHSQIPWLREAFEHLALQAESFEVHLNLSEVPIPGLIPGDSNSSSKELSTSSTKKQAEPDGLPEGLPDHLAEAARRSLPVLQRVAEARAARPVTLAALGRAVEAFPDRDHAKVAGELEHWCLHGNGAKAPCKDVVARYRRFLDNSMPVARSSVSVTPTRDYSAYDATMIVDRGATNG